ncbi:MAG: hypothetical protein DRO93_12530 [Candidatus Thorarchaeota archaeon]|nr:MAG: hypothetical protein DRO93_12530 [Candidatus Thorarchaeota archaeon]
MVLDVDDVSREEIKARIEQAPVKQSYIVWSGKGAHLYFLFDRPYEETAKFTGFKPIANKLADIFGADGGASYRARYMRTLPYTYNSKYYPQEKLIALLEEMPYLTFYLPEEIDLLVRRYFESDDEPQDPPSLIPNLEKPQKPKTNSAKNRKVREFPRGIAEQYEKLKSKHRGLMKCSKRFHDIATGKAPEIRKAKSASERVFIYALELATHGFPKWFARLELENWVFGLLNGNRAEQMRNKPELAKMRLDSILDGAYEKHAPENRVLAVMSKGKGFSLERLCRLTGFNIAKLKHYVRILREQGKLEVKLSYRNGKPAMICRKPLNINASEKIREQIKEREERYLSGYRYQERENGRTRVKNRGRPAKSVAVGKIDTHERLENKVKIRKDTELVSELKIDTQEERLATPLRLVNPEIASELVKLEGRDKSEIKALYGALPKTNPLIAMFEKRVSELGVTGLEKDEAFALWVLQEKAKLNQKPKFYTGFT